MLEDINTPAWHDVAHACLTQARIAERALEAAKRPTPPVPTAGLLRTWPSPIASGEHDPTYTVDVIVTVSDVEADSRDSAAGAALAAIKECVNVDWPVITNVGVAGVKEVAQ
jgi:hypothetical protein